VLLALSFCFKLQAVFVMPVFAVLLFAGKIRWKHLPVFPLAYILLILPAVIAGRPFRDTLLIYFRESGSVGTALNYNSSSVYAFFRSFAHPEAAAKLGIFAAFAFLLLLLAICFVFRKRLNDRLILIAALLIAVGIPFLLPHMHDRYFFAADALSLILVFGLPILAPIAALTQFASLLGYYAYFVKRFLLLMDHGARSLILVLVTLWVCFILELKKSPEKVLDNRG
jgi:Gpi18-like mannosyltransferase